MDIGKVILQLRAFAPVFNGNVAGAAAYANAVQDQVWLGRETSKPKVLPAAYVIPSNDSASENRDEVALYQIVTERVVVIVDFDNSSDRRGQTAAEQLLYTRYQIYKALLNWRPDYNYLVPDDPANRESRGMYYTGGELMLLDRARLHYAFEFALDTTITDADGWQLPADPLLDIRMTVVNGFTGKPLATADAPLAQPPGPPPPDTPQWIIDWLAANPPG